MKELFLGPRKTYGKLVYSEFGVHYGQVEEFFWNSYSDGKMIFLYTDLYLIFSKIGIFEYNFVQMR